MTPSNPNRLRIGLPWRTSQEEASGSYSKLENYGRAIREAGAEAVVLSLSDPAGLERELPGLDGFVLPGSPADVEPAEYNRERSALSAEADLPRERTDRAILDHAFAEKKPVLAICYGCQMLNVYRGGTLIQDLWSETGTRTAHRKKDLQPEPADDPRHGLRMEPRSRVAEVAASGSGEVNSSHHQSVEEAGSGLVVTSHANDGTVESVEWTGDANWVVGVQWHPERMRGERLGDGLFRELVAAARTAKSISATKA